MHRRLVPTSSAFVLAAALACGGDAGEVPRVAGTSADTASAATTDDASGSPAGRLYVWAGDLDRAALLWGAIEDEDANAPLGGWRRHRDACEARLREVVGPDLEARSAKGRELTLDEGVALALDF